MRRLTTMATTHAGQFDNEVDRSWAEYSYLEGAKEALELAADICVDYSINTDGAMTALECASRIRSLSKKD